MGVAVGGACPGVGVGGFLVGSAAGTAAAATFGVAAAGTSDGPVFQQAAPRTPTAPHTASSKSRRPSTGCPPFSRTDSTSFPPRRTARIARHGISNNVAAHMTVRTEGDGSEAPDIGRRQSLERRHIRWEMARAGECERRVRERTSGFGDGGFGGDSATCRDASVLPSIGRTACFSVREGCRTAASGFGTASGADRRLLHHGVLRVPILSLLQKRIGRVVRRAELIIPLLARRPATKRAGAIRAGPPDAGFRESEPSPLR